MKQLNSIQYLRATAALLVLYAHAIDLQTFLSDSFQQHFYYLENFGAIGVDIFFVISGFIIAYIARGKSGLQSANNFIKRRVIRVIPSYYLVSIVLFILATAFGKIPITTHNIIKSITILPIFDTGIQFWTPILFLGWTLAFEFLFYLFFFFSIMIALHHKNIKVVTIMILLVIAGRVFAFENIQWRFITNPIILEFCCGVLIACLYQTIIRIPRTISLIIICTAIALFLLLILKDNTRISEMEDTLNGTGSLLRFFYWGIPSALLVFGFVFLEKVSSRPVFTNKWMLLLGDASYSVYLVHIIVYRSLLLILKKFQGQIQQIPGDILILVYIIIAIAMSVAFYLLVEKRMLNALNKKFTPAPSSSSMQQL